MKMFEKVLLTTINVCFLLIEIYLFYMLMTGIYYGDEAGLDGFDDPYCRRAYPWGRENEDLMDWYKKVTSLRNDPIFNGGSYQEVKFTSSLVMYKRIKGGKEILVVINNSNVFYEETRACFDMLENKKVDSIYVSPYSAKVYKL